MAEHAVRTPEQKKGDKIFWISGGACVLLLSILGFSYFEEINSKILGIFILCVFFFPFITWLLYKSFWNKGSKKIADFSDRIGDDPVKEIKRIFKGPST